MIWTLLVGIAVGYIACELMKVKTVWWMKLILGLLGGVVGGVIRAVLGATNGGILGFICSIAGACIIVWAYRKLKK